MNAKPIVTFGEFRGFEEYNDGSRTAVLWVVRGHPRLGNVPKVYTSKVVSVDNEENPTRIETNNTVYVKELPNVQAA
jgi:hypothetical protein